MNNLNCKVKFHYRDYVQIKVWFWSVFNGRMSSNKIIWSKFSPEDWKLSLDLISNWKMYNLLLKWISVNVFQPPQSSYLILFLSTTFEIILLNSGSPIIKPRLLHSHTILHHNLIIKQQNVWYPFIISTVVSGHSGESTQYVPSVTFYF